MNQRDVELLSAYLDGQLKPLDSARLEVRLKSDPQLVSVLDDLRAARNLLRQLPQRRAPRAFTLTRKMVGQNPPLPRAYPVFRFATAIATLLFFFTVGLNFLAPQFTQAALTGRGGGGDTESFSQAAPLAAAATEAPATQAPAEQPPAVFAPASTQEITPSADAARISETPAAKAGDQANSVNPNQPQAGNEAQSPMPLVSSTWQVALAVIAILGALLMVLMRQSAFNRWRK